jgi:malate dehydrogenase
MGKRKVSIMGAGRVGATLAQILCYKKIADDIVLWNRTAPTAQGIALDVMESAPIEGFSTTLIGTGDPAAIADSDIVVITAGAQRKEGMSRDDLLNENAGIVSLIAEQIKKYAPQSVVIVMTNPLDAMVYITFKKTGFSKLKVIGQAGILDSSRLSYLIAAELKRDVKDVSAMVLGSHGDTMVPLLGYTYVAGVPVKKLISKEGLDQIIQRTRDGGAEIIGLEASSAFYAPASSVALMVDSILMDKKMKLPCSAYLEGEYEITGMFVGVPVILGGGGIEKIVELALEPDEKVMLAASAQKIGAITEQAAKLC